jgi:hypothetical protein
MVISLLVPDDLFLGPRDIIITKSILIVPINDFTGNGPNIGARRGIQYCPRKLVANLQKIRPVRRLADRLADLLILHT